jgi:hypothetical protein
MFRMYRQWGLIMVAMVVMGCPSRQNDEQSDQLEQPDTYSPWEEDTTTCIGSDCIDPTGDVAVADGEDFMKLIVTPPGPCGWAVQGEAAIPVTGALFLDGSAVPGHPMDQLALYFVDPDSGEEVLLDSLESVAVGSLIFDGKKVPGGLQRFIDGPPEAPLRIRGSVTSPDGELLQTLVNRTLLVDLVAPAVEIQVPTSGSLITPYVEQVPYTVLVTDDDSGFGEVTFIASDVLLETLSSGVLSEPPLTTLTGLLDASPLGVATTALEVHVKDCVGNSGMAQVPLAVVSSPKFLEAPTVSCEDVKDQLVVEMMRQVRAGQGDADSAYVDLLLSAGEGAYVSWGLGEGEFAGLKMAAPGYETRDAHFVELSGDGVPDIVTLSRAPEGKGFVVTEWLQAANADGEGLHLFFKGDLHEVGEDPFTMELADVDGDGMEDVVVGHTDESESVMILRHVDPEEVDSPYLEEAAILTGVAEISDLKLGDVNGDELPDIAVTRGKTGILSTYLNSGGNFLMAHDTLLMGQDVPLLGLGDFNSDGNSDAMVVVLDLGAAYELNGKGNGYFEQTDNADLGWSLDATEAVASIYSSVLQVATIPKAGKAVIVSKSSNGLVVNDFNLDGLPDVAISEEKGGTVQLFWGMGDGTLAESYFLNAWPKPYSLITADLNQDPIPDMALLRKNSCEIVLFLSRDDGGCGQPGNGIELPCPFPPGDENRAGVPLWSTSAEIPTPVHPQWMSVGRVTPDRILAADFDLDGRSDVVAITSPPADQEVVCTVTVDGEEHEVEEVVDPHAVISYTGIGQADLTADTLKSMMGIDFYHGISDVAAGYFNDDNYLDIAVASKKANKSSVYSNPVVPNYDILSGGYAMGTTGGSGWWCELIPIQGDFPGSFVPTGGSGVPSHPAALAAARLNDDGLDDLILAITGVGIGGNNPILDEIQIRQTEEAPNVCIPGPGLMPPPFQTCTDWPYTQCHAQYSLCDVEDAVAYPTTGQNPVAVAVGDMNNDDIQDIMVANQLTHNVTLLEGSLNQFGRYRVNTDQKPAKLISLGEEPLDITLGDVDGDGFLDLIGAFKYKASISWGSDGTNFETPFYFEETPEGEELRPTRVKAGDFNGDGRDDVIVLCQKTSRIYLYISLGERKFAGPYTFTAATEPSDIQMTDVNQDGCMDLVVSNEKSKTISLLINEFCPSKKSD